MEVYVAAWFSDTLSKLSIMAGKSCADEEYIRGIL